VSARLGVDIGDVVLVVVLIAEIVLGVAVAVREASSSRWTAEISSVSMPASASI
jgi:hypothetical protein